MELDELLGGQVGLHRHRDALVERKRQPPLRREILLQRHEIADHVARHGVHLAAEGLQQRTPAGIGILEQGSQHARLQLVHRAVLVPAAVQEDAVDAMLGIQLHAVADGVENRVRREVVVEVVDVVPDIEAAGAAGPLREQRRELVLRLRVHRAERKIDGADQHAGVLRQRLIRHAARRPVMGGKENVVRELLAQAPQQMVHRAGTIMFRVPAGQAALAVANDGIVVGQDGEAHRMLVSVVGLDVILDVAEERVGRETELFLVDRDAVLRVNARGRFVRQDGRKIMAPDAPVPIDTVQVLRCFLLLRERGQMDLPVLEGGRAGVRLHVRTASQQHRPDQYANQG